MSPRFRSASTMVRRPPRLGTSCHIRWLDFVMSIGFTRKKVATYSTLPLAFRGASRISVMRRLCGASGSSSPNARPASVSYGPALPNDLPSKAGETFRSMTMRLTSAAAVDVHTKSSRTIERYLIDDLLSRLKPAPTSTKLSHTARLVARRADRHLRTAHRRLPLPPEVIERRVHMDEDAGRRLVVVLEVGHRHLLADLRQRLAGDNALEHAVA